MTNNNSSNGTWNSSPHPISDVKDWQQARRLEVRPDFQRREVWSQAARVMLIDTILRGIPMPKMFVWNEIVNGSTHRRVIDGQQRVSAILDFINDKFPLSSPYEGDFLGKTFSELPQTVRDKFLQYRIDFNEALGFSEKEVREVYSRVNKYSLPLNKQELRQADYPGQFLNLSIELSAIEYLDESRIFTAANRRRMGDVEFISEILAGMLAGPQDKKDDLDYFYSRYREWPEEEVDGVRLQFLAVIDDLKKIFAETILPLRLTRFRQRSDFYSLFLSINALRLAKHSLDGKDLSPLQRDLMLLHKNIAPESNIDVLSEYAIKCVSQANSQSSRAWRRNFLTSILDGTYRSRKPSGSTLNRFSHLMAQLSDSAQTSMFDDCILCNLKLDRRDVGERVLDWPNGTTVFQLSNAGWRGQLCHEPCEN